MSDPLLIGELLGPQVNFSEETQVQTRRRKGMVEFVVHLLGLSPGLVIPAASRHRESLKNPAKSVGEYLEMLEREGMTETVLRDHMLGD